MPRPPKICTVEITKTKRPGYRFAASIYGPDGGRERRYFRTRQDAERLRATKMKDWAAPGMHLDLEPAEKEAVRLARRVGLNLLEVVRKAVADASWGNQSMPLSKAAEKLMESLKNSGRSLRHEQGMRAILMMAIQRWGDVLVSQVTSDMVSDLVFGPQGISGVTRNNYRSRISVFFSWAAEQGWCASNPALKVKAPRHKAYADEIGILSPAQARDLLAAVAEMAPALLPATAIGMFAGLRSAELQRLTWDEVWLSRGVIVVSAGKSKTKTRRLVTIHPPLAAILEPLIPADKTGRVWPQRKWRTTWDRAIKRAGWRGDAQYPPVANPNDPPWPRNALRHSFVSYHVAGFQDSGRTALEAGHTQQMLFRHYRELATEDEAAEFWTAGFLD